MYGVTPALHVRSRRTFQVRHQMTGQTKAALARYDYAPYGELLRNAGLPLTVSYTGHLWDSAIGQYYARFRFYNPQTARWNMHDPLVYYYPLGLDKLTSCAQKNLRYSCPD
ncbi:MAG: hypothetical protein BWY09_01445 [Candidatus Hydrogenedentes bacterium ADurb.Bin179]|nr:MAG: hypothetical protein BWY09_01445 [Candidatus Hydrogenedentes bacterium ADurb.Bin179]